MSFPRMRAPSLKFPSAVVETVQPKPYEISSCKSELRELKPYEIPDEWMSVRKTARRSEVHQLMRPACHVVCCGRDSTAIVSAANGL